MMALRALRSSSRSNCHSPSHQAAHASSTTTTANRTHRRLSRNRQERTPRGYPPSGRPTRPATVPLDSAAWDTMALQDRYGRVATDLRVSLTDRCNLRCSYCMPAEGLDWLPGDEVLTDDEVVRLIDIGVRRLGVREVRFTGGEPLVRRGLVDIVRRTKAIDPSVDVSLTTNALGLERTAQALADAGLDRVNVSLDTVRARHLPHHHPARPVRRRRRRARGGQGRRSDAGEDQRGAAARHQRRPGARAAALGARPTATSCGSSSRCRSTPSTTGAGPRWSRPRRSSPASSRSSR